MKCSFAYPGTYGHECGRPSTWVGRKPSEHTVSGVFFAHRCDECKDARGQDNIGVSQWQRLPADPASQVQFQNRYR